MKTIVGLGEILWDLLPGGKQLGGAPANFAYHAAQLGNRGVVVSRIGTDELGDEILHRLAGRQLTAEYIQRDPASATGTVEVEMDARGEPSYTIVEDVAWDRMQWTPELDRLAAQTDAVCFGSLAQRDARSRETILRFIAACPAETVRIFDINLRGNYYSAELLTENLNLAQVAKLNDEELVRVSRTLDVEPGDEEVTARRLIDRFALDLVCVTRGARGSLLVSEKEADDHPGIAVEVVDTVGSGDAFVAAVAHHLLRGSPLEEVNRAANRLGSYVAGQQGAMPPISDEVLSDVA